MKLFNRAFWAAILVTLILGVLLALPAIAQISNFDSIVASGDVIAGDDLTVGDDAVIGGLYKLTAATAISVTTDATITPTGSYQPLESAGNVQTSSIAVLAAGTVVHFVNTANTTITFTDTGTLKLSGNAALGQYDSLILLSDGTNWIEVSETNN